MDVPAEPILVRPDPERLTDSITKLIEGLPVNDLREVLKATSELLEAAPADPSAQSSLQQREMQASALESVAAANDELIEERFRKLSVGSSEEETCREGQLELIVWQLRHRLHAAEKENERLRRSKPNGPGRERMDAIAATHDSTLQMLTAMEHCVLNKIVPTSLCCGGRCKCGPSCRCANKFIRGLKMCGDEEQGTQHCINYCTQCPSAQHIVRIDLYTVLHATPDCPAGIDLQHLTSSAIEAGTLAANEPEAKPCEPSTVELSVAGMTCGKCVGRVERALRAVEGVVSASVELASSKAVVHGTAAVDVLVAAVSDAGYTCRSTDGNIHMSVHMSTHMSIHISTHVSIPMCIHMSTHMSIHIHTHAAQLMTR